MITPSKIYTKADQKYIPYLQALAQGEPFIRIEITGDKTYTKTSLSEFEKEILSITSQSKEKNGFGYTIDFQTVKTKYLGTQDLPAAIYFDTEYDFLKYLGKTNEAELFRTDSHKISASFPALTEWIAQKPSKVVQNQGKWDNILRVCDYFVANPAPNMYIRELPIAVHTKFVEQNQSIIRELLDILIADTINQEETQFEKRFNLKYSQPQIRFKILDTELSNQYFSGLTDMAIPVNDFEQLTLPVERVIIVENKTTLYTALTLPAMLRTIAVFGSGYGVSNLRNATWLTNTTILYWGDIDVQGFEILSQFRSHFPHTQSILMDQQCFAQFSDNERGTPTNNSIPIHLTDSEQELYKKLKTNNWRLEQEKIPFDYVCQHFQLELLREH